MKKACLLILLFINTTGLLMAQTHQIIKSEFSPENIVGTWKAIDGDKSYILQFEPQTVTHKRVTISLILGKIDYYDGNKLTRSTQFNGLLSLLTGNMSSTHFAHFQLIDSDRGATSDVSISINGSGTEAKWKLEPTERKMFPEYKKNEVDLPKVMILIKQV